MNKHGIERQTLAVAAIPMLILALLLEGYFTYVSFSNMDTDLSERAKLVVRQLASSSEYPVFSGNLTLLQRQVGIAFSHQDVKTVVVRNTEFKKLASAGNETDANERVLFQSVLPVSGGPVIFQEDRNALWLYEPILVTQVDLEELGSDNATNRYSKVLGSVIVGVGKDELNSKKKKMLLFNFVSLLLVLSTATLVAMRVSRRITAPVLEMDEAIRSIGRGNLDTRIAGNRVKELDALAAGINKMASQLQHDRHNMQKRIDDATREMRIKKEEAEKANFDKSRFLAAASHDLRQPMHALGLFVGELQSRLDKPEQRKVANKVEESVEALSSLLDSLLDISKLDAGIVVPQIQGVDITPMLTRLQQDFLPIAQRKNIELRVRCFEATVMSDPVLLERILLNLLSNAIRYAPHGGSVLMACRHSGDDVRIEVRDNGVGIPADEQRNVFREFVQLENSARERSKGLGLGLAIVQRLTKLLHHRVTLRSAPGRGSTFALTIPRMPGVEELLAEGAAPAAALSRHDQLIDLKVLVVDDDMLVRTSTAGILESWGCHVEVAEDMQEFKEMFGNEDFDLILCDYRLPDGDGLTLADYIFANRTQRPAFVLISGDTAPEILRKVSEHGLHLLHKPVRPGKLRSLILFLLKNRDAQSGASA